MNVIDLIYALMLQSANDAACVLAHRIAGGIEEFANLMNRKAEELSLKNTHFANPHGLDAKDHYTTARDLSILTAEAMKNDRFLEIASTKKYEIHVSDQAKTIVNHNKMLNRHNGCIGVKTGYTKKCGRCLVSSANNNGIQVITVTLDAPDDWRDHEKLFDLAYSKIERRTLCERGDFEYDLKVLGGKSDTIHISAKEKATAIVDKNANNISTHVKISQYFSAPIAKGDVLGTVIFAIDGKEISRAYLVAQESIDTSKGKYRFFINKE
jgi:D-alanyl-D-alanine carboxypeptidase/D-alanyl-D-alanine carboxypeptidase (penicillin-binding protein 5/6)